ncbi:hypothetical protein RJ640_019077 [Escallonia rubra]|uniref:Uncharacterized protein n=1 Tax=Escallonia rubra TaxID=112253 RepID=A0AA88RX42_9ASTE|nr:hypothetical protein RJ640_019077 [Escallonia rubra]
MTTTTTSTFLAVATQPPEQFQFSLPKQRLNINRWSNTGQSFLSTSSFNLIPVLLRSTPLTSVSASVIEEEQEGSATTEDSDPLLPLRGCKACGKEEIESGCNGEGRIQGGIATVPGFGWWPIKAYRPCPGFVASGGRYRRRGQSMDEVAGFGRVEVGAPMGTKDEAQPR